MKHTKRTPLLCLLSLFLLLATPAIVQAGAETQSDRDNRDGWTGTWSFPALYVGGKDGAVYAQAAYEFDENCNPVLVGIVRLNYIPAWVSEPEQKPLETKTIEILPPPSPMDPQSRGDASILAVNTCHIKTWEEDAVGLDMIAVQNDQNYSWDSISVTLGQGSVTATTYFSWWYLSSGPHGTAGYYSSQVAWANGDASFYCNGGPFCGGGPTYYITLYNRMTVDYLGGCGGYGTYSGTVVPGGRVLYSTWRT